MMSFFWLVSYRMFQRVYTELFKQMFNQIQSQSESIYILDHLDESIVIVSEQQNQLEFVNDLFLHQFKSQIYQYRDDEEIKASSNYNITGLQGGKIAGSIPSG